MKQVRAMDTVEQSQLFHSMLRIRRIEEALARKYAEQEMRCPIHLCVGQEAIAVGVCAALNQTDLVFSNHRAHGHYLAKGGGLAELVAEVYGRETGCCGGRGGSMHLIDLSVGFMGSTPIVGGTVPLAVGAAWAATLKRNRQVTVSFFGDGCFEEGVVHESLNFAALHKIPVVFVCENNDFSVYTRRTERQPDRPMFEIAQAHGVEAATGNGNDVEEVFNIATTAIDKARCGLGPQFLEFRTYRWREHCGPNFDDDLRYRLPLEIEAGLNACPIAHYRSKLTKANGLSGLDIDRYELEIQAEIEVAFNFALSSRRPGIEDANRKVYA